MKWILDGFAVFLFLVVSGTTSFADIYRHVDDNGRVYFSDKPLAEGADRVELQINSFSAPKIDAFRFDPSLISNRRSTQGVVMYSAVWCGYCKKARRYFDAKNIPFEEYDVETSVRGKRDYKAMNGRGVPIILVGDGSMTGFSSTAFERLYNP